MAGSPIDTLKQKRRELDQQIKAAQARRRDIAGGVILKHITNNPDSEFSRQWHRLVNTEVSKPKDRVLLGLAPSSPPYISSIKEQSS